MQFSASNSEARHAIPESKSPAPTTRLRAGERMCQRRLRCNVTGCARPASKVSNAFSRFGNWRCLADKDPRVTSEVRSGAVNQTDSPFTNQRSPVSIHGESMPSLLRTWLQLFRAPNLFSVPGEPLAGYLLASYGAVEPKLFLPLVASVCLYAGGLLLNDLVDLREDLAERPQRPLPSLSLIHISEPTRLLSISYAVFCLKKKKKR